MTEEIYSLKDVSYGYNGGTVALSGINLSIRDSETISILGANGSGKSTLLKILDGLNKEHEKRKPYPRVIGNGKGNAL